ncbi:hypothetical protein J3E71DRAFT_360410 [Bipolaris maydis]|nr:hypothetical protein J3E71DRAFT_360410 [Bipolaris maydis]
METSRSILDDLTELTRHEELLRHHSRVLEERFSKAEPLRELYEQSHALRNKIAAHVFPEVTEDDSEASSHQEQLILLTMSAYDSYPLPAYHEAIRKLIDVATQDAITSKHVKTRKFAAATYDSDIRARLACIKPRSVYAIVQKLFARLHRIEKKEFEAAKKDPLRAAAQKRIVIPGFEQDAVQFVMQWIYKGALSCEDLPQLYNTLQLARLWGIEALVEFCENKLYTIINGLLQSKLGHCTALQSLFECSLNQDDNSLRVIFQIILKDQNAPKRLQELIIKAVATDLNLETWPKLKPLVSHDTVVKLIGTLVQKYAPRSASISSNRDMDNEDKSPYARSLMHVTDV